MSLPEFDITGKKVLCVGAGRGIGKGIALAFAEAGADVAITGLTSVGATKVAEEVRKTLLHEVGHYLGLSEEDLGRLGYG